jgi:hypothetical protein
MELRPRLDPLLLDAHGVPPETERTKYYRLLWELGPIKAVRPWLNKMSARHLQVSPSASARSSQVPGCLRGAGR